MAPNVTSAPPTLAELVAAARPSTFPGGLLSGAKSAFSFFSAAFYGRSDVVFLHLAEIQEIALVDIDMEKLCYMQTIYPSVTEIIADDARAAAARLVEAGRSADIVVCDPFTNHSIWCARDHFANFWKLANRYYIFGVTPPAFEALGIEPTADAMARAMRELHGASLIELKARNSLVYWACIAGARA